MRPHGLAATMAVAISGTAATAWAQPCQGYYAGPGVPWAQGRVPSDAVAFDDGSGPAIYARISQLWTPHRWRHGDSGWTPIVAGLPTGFTITQFVVLDDGSGPHLFAYGGTQFAPLVSGTARWNGAAWEFLWPLAPASAPFVLPQCSADIGDGMAIYGEEYINSTGGTIVRWFGGQWQVIGVASQGPITLAPFQSSTGTMLYASGVSSINGIQIPGFARWTGQTWVPAGDLTMHLGIPAGTFDDGSGPALYGIGDVILDSQLHRSALLRFDGEHWTVLGEPPQAGFTGTATVNFFDDGRGPAIVVGGTFSSYAGVPANNLARYDPRQGWSAVGAGLSTLPGGSSGITWAAVLPTSRGPALEFFGTFNSAGGGAINNSVAYIGCPNCYANCDQSSVAPVLNVNDFVCFLNRFAARAPEANCNNDASIDVADFVCFLNRFAAGCP